MDSIIETMAMSRFSGWVRHLVSMLIGVLVAKSLLNGAQADAGTQLLNSALAALGAFGWLLIQHYLQSCRLGIIGARSTGSGPSGTKTEMVAFLLIPALALSGCAVLGDPAAKAAFARTLEIVGVKVAEAFGQAVLSQAVSAIDAKQKVDISQGLAQGLRTLEGTAVDSGTLEELAQAWTPAVEHWQALAAKLKQIYTDAAPVTLAQKWAVLERMAVVLETPPATGS